MAPKKKAQPEPERKADWAKINRLLHLLWGECKDGTYDKEKWKELSQELERAKPKTEAPDPLATLFVVRLFDMFDGWIDVSEPVTKAEADRVLNEKTDGGKKNTSYSDGDYYSIFPANTRMLVTSETMGR
jgi:hypothetical protein